MVAHDFIGRGYPVRTVLRMVGLPRSSYYYRPKERARPKGRPPSSFTATVQGGLVCNGQVVGSIAEILSREFVDYGYVKVTWALRQEFGYLINPKKVYRLMRENGMLNRPVARPRAARRWVTDLVPDARSAFEYLEFDIKYVWVEGIGRNVLVLSVLDVYSRWLLGHVIAWSITEHDVVRLFERLFQLYCMPRRAWVRNDNGSQMTARSVQDFFDGAGIVQEFTKPATPEQNAHIEAYHSIVERVICGRYEFSDLAEVQATFARWQRFYNEERIHSALGFTSPLRFLRKLGVEPARATAPQSGSGPLAVQHHHNQ